MRKEEIFWSVLNCTWKRGADKRSVVKIRSLFLSLLLYYIGGWEGKKREEQTFFPRWAANVGITNRRPAARQRPAVLKQTVASLSLLFGPLFVPLVLSFVPSLLPAGCVYMRARWAIAIGPSWTRPLCLIS